MNAPKIDAYVILYTKDWGVPYVLLVKNGTSTETPLSLPGGSVKDCGLIGIVTRSIADHTGINLEAERLRVLRVIDSPNPDKCPITVIYTAFLPDDLMPDGTLTDHADPAPKFYNLRALADVSVEPEHLKIIKSAFERSTAVSPRSLIED